MTALPAPTRPNHSAASVTAFQAFATAAVMRPGDGFTIEPSPKPSQFVNMKFTEPPRGTRPAHTVVISLHRAGIPAVIAELQRLMTVES